MQFFYILILIKIIFLQFRLLLRRVTPGSLLPRTVWYIQQ